MNINKILEMAIQKDASDVHLVCGRKPTLRIARDLIQIEEMEQLKESDMYEIYDYFVRGNVEKDATFQEEKRLDLSFVYEETRLRVNISIADDIPIFTLRLIKNTLPNFSELGIPDVVRRMIYQPQGVILVTGKTNSGKTTTFQAITNAIFFDESMM